MQNYKQMSTMLILTLAIRQLAASNNGNVVNVHNTTSTDDTLNSSFSPTLPCPLRHDLSYQSRQCPRFNLFCWIKQIFHGSKHQSWENNKVIQDECWTNINKDKLIIFLHFHKAGGSSLADSARSVTTFYPSDCNDCNGNPRMNHKYIPYWTYSSEQLIDFIMELKSKKVSFIAMENQFWIKPDLIHDIKKEYNIELITQIRNPFDRFVSNFFYANIWKKDYKESQSMSAKDIKTRLLEFHNSTVRSNDRFPCQNSWNFYVRILSGIYDNKLFINESDFEIAKQRLEMFDAISIMELKETHKLLANKYGIQPQEYHSRNSGDKYKKQYHGNEDLQILKEFEKEFKTLNKYDYMLYKYATELSSRMLGYN